jgi:hypothetical protein
MALTCYWQRVLRIQCHFEADRRLWVLRFEYAGDVLSDHDAGFNVDDDGDNSEDAAADGDYSGLACGSTLRMNLKRRIKRRSADFKSLVVLRQELSNIWRWRQYS